jgi:hypothetical protein
VDDGSATALTDETGAYHFPAVTSRRRQPRSEPDIFVMQTIATRVDEREYSLWRATRYTFEDNGELGGKPIRISHELTDPEQSYVIPSYSESPTNVDGVVTIDHPYVHDLERGERAVNRARDRLTADLLERLNTTEVTRVLNQAFVAPVVQPHRIASFRKLTQVSLRDYALFADAGRSQVSLDRNPFLGFTIGANAVVALDDGSEVSVPLYWPGAVMRLPGDEDDVPELLGDVTRATLDARELMRTGAEELLEPGAISVTLRTLLEESPGEQIAYALDDRLRLADLVYGQKNLPARYSPGFGIHQLAVNTVRALHVNVEAGHVSVTAYGTIGTSRDRPALRFRAWVCVALDSLPTGQYRLVANEQCKPQLTISTFSITMEMAQRTSGPDEPLILHFSVTNLLAKQNIFLIWHTPFEGFRNEFLKIEHLDSGSEVPYEGPLASRVPPTRENGSYLEFGPSERRTATIDLRDAYTIRKPGHYRVTFLALGRPDETDAPFAEFDLAGPA